MATYNTPLITVALIAIYLVSLFLSRQGKYLTVALHRKIWNALLVITFVLTALSAIFYLLMLDYNLDIVPQQIDVSFWHIEFGLAFVLIGVFHALWHIPYFKQYLPSSPARAGGEQSRLGATQKEKPKPAAPVSQPVAPENKPPI